MSRTRTRDTKQNGAAGVWTVTLRNLHATLSVNLVGYTIPAGGIKILSIDQYVDAVKDGRELFGEKSSITDQPQGLGTYNEVVHDKEEWSYPLQVLPYYEYRGSKGGVPWVATFEGSASASLCQRNNPSGGSYPGMESFSSLKVRAASSMRLQPPMGFDMAQFIGELTDFDSLVKSIGGRLLAFPKKLKELLRGSAKGLNKRRWQGWSGRLRDITIRDLVETGVSADLAYKLLWVPLFRDIKSIRRAMYDYDRAYRRLLDPEPFIARGTAVASGNATPFDYGSSTLNHSIRSYRSRHLEVHAWARVALEAFVPPDNLFFRHYWGLWPRVSVAWELTPLSFVIDWFVDVGKWLRQFEKSPLQVPYRLIQGGYSTKETVTHSDELTWSVLGTDLSGARPPGVTGRYQKVAYRRIGDPLIIDPHSIQPLTISLPDLGQTGTLAELVFLSFNKKLGV